MSPIDPQPKALPDTWSELPSAEWTDTLETLHLWSQIVGKVRTGLSPWVNHSWSSTLYVTSRGLTTSPFPHDGRTLEIDFDFVEHRLPIRVSDGRARELTLEAKSVAAFYDEVLGALAGLGLEVSIHPETNVGGYVNTGWDMVANLVGAGVAASLIRLTHQPQ